MTLDVTQESPQDAPPQGEDAPPSVLVVDDEVELARVVARGLTHAGYQVSVAHDGREALALLAERRFDLLLTDINMPQMTGIELQQIARGKDPDLAVILITAAQDTRDAVESMREGVFDYVVKPAPLADMTVRVQKALERRRLVLENRDYQLNLERRVAEQADRIRQMSMKALETLSHALEAKDENTRNHSVRVADLVTALAGSLAPGNTAFKMKLRLAALLHDIGKIGIPEAILNKPGRLEPEEYAQIQRHPVVGDTILRPMLGEDADIMAVVRNHHERWDGQGYPDRLAGEDTPLGARIAAVADAYDAMTSARPYRAGMTPEEALQILREGAGTQWDPAVVAAAVELSAAGHFRAKTQAVPSALTPDLGVGPKSGTCSAPLPTVGTSARSPVIFVRDHLDSKAVERLGGKVEALLGLGRNRFVLDMQGVQALDAAAVLHIHRMHQKAEAAGGRMVIRDATELALTMFYEAGVAEALYFDPPSRYMKGMADTRRAA
jgi:putative two-component system response regulator